MNDNNWIQDACTKQDDYSNIFAEWRFFDSSHTEYIKSTIGIMLFGIRDDVENPPQHVSYYRVYSTENRRIIETIYERIMDRCRGDVYLSCTYLIGRLEDGEVFSFPVLRYSPYPTAGRIYFAECSGRYYKDWSDLTSSIQLPPCDLIAPSNGLYSSSNRCYEKFKSPAATSTAQVARVANVVASGGAIACTVATMCAFAPITFAVLGTSLSAYCVGQSIQVLRDRSSHGQSIALNNRESILSYGNIVASGLSGASFAAVSNLGRLQRIFGNYANSVTTTCKVLNISTVIFDSTFLLIDAFDFMTKLRDGTVTTQDAFSLSLQIFLVCGAVVQARDMHRLLNQTKISSSGAANKKLTRTQKRNLQKRRAKARARGETLSVVASQSIENNTLTVGENDLYSSMKTFSLRVGAFGVNVMLSMYPRAEIILNYYYDLRDLITATFVNRTMGIKVFLQEIFYQTRNLYTIIRQDIARMQEILRVFIPDPIVNENEMIAQTVNQELDRVDQAAEEFMPMLELGISEDIEQQEDQNTSIAETRGNMILKFVHDVCSRYTTEDTADALISFFHSVLIFTANYVSENSIQLFDQVFERSKATVGEENAKKMTSVLGIKTESDFYPTKDFMEKVLKNTEIALEEFIEHDVGIKCEKGSCSSIAQEIFDQLNQLLSSMHAQVNAPNETDELGILHSTCTLKELSIILEDKLGNECRKISFDSRSIYEDNIDILGQKITEEMMKTIEMPTTERETYQSALKLLNIEAIISLMKLKYSTNNSNESVQPTYSGSEIQPNKNPHDEAITELITILYKRINELLDSTRRRNKYDTFKAVLNERILKRSEPIPQFESKGEMFIAVTKFVSEKLITELKLDAKLCEELKPNEELVGPKLLKSMLKTIGKYSSEKSYLFKTKVQILQSERNLETMVAEFSKRYCNVKVDLQQPKIFDTTTGDDGFVTHKMMCDQNGSDSSFRELVHLLFKFEVNELDCEIVRDKRSVVVKSRNKVVLFSFPDEENVAVVILSDLDSENMSTD